MLQNMQHSCCILPKTSERAHCQNQAAKPQGVPQRSVASRATYASPKCSADMLCLVLNIPHAAKCWAWGVNQMSHNACEKAHMPMVSLI
ncbi:hypothetical protein ABBQ38_012200 [Trebouxia sp. C0009 RCD-2024]